MAYATVEQLESRWRALTPSEREQAGALLDDASTILDSYVSGDDDFNLLSIIACNMVRRAMDPETVANSQLLDAGWEPQAPASRLLAPDWTELKMLRRGSKIGFAKIGA